MNEKNEIKKPDSLIVASAQSELWQTIKSYNFPLYIMELIAISLYLEIKGLYKDQLENDQAAYDQKRKDSEEENQKETQKEGDHT